MTTELDALAGAPEEFKLSSGVFVRLEDLRTRQLLKLLKIVTRGGAHLLNDFNVLDPNVTREEFGTRFVALIVMAIPEAEDETIEFLRSMTSPVGMIEGRKLGPGDKERNEAIWAQYVETIANPELEDLIDLIEAIVRREAEDIQSLGKRLASVLKLAQKTDPEMASVLTSRESPTSTPEESSEASPEPSI